MTAPGWYNEGKKLIEGETYPFQFIRIIPLSDNMNYMLMEDPYGIRHLVPYDYYIQYDLVTGSTINCRVDKINCTGRVFLEPEHPHYKIGSRGNFDLLRIEKSQNDEKIHCLIVLDIFGNEVIMEVCDEIQDNLQNSKINCLIEGIKKGVPVLKFIGRPGI